MNIRNRLTLISLLFIILLASVVRFYQLDTNPPSLTWDEVAVGYNAYSIIKYGHDEWGHLLPIVFTSFEDDKNPVHVYFTVLSVMVFGLNDFSVRAPMALFGVLVVIISFLLAKELFKNELVGLVSALFIAISPYSIHFSRFNHEANFALFFLFLGMWLFIKGIGGKSYCITWSYISFGLGILSYNSAKLVIPVIVLLLSVLYIKQLWKFKTDFIIGCLALVIIMSGFFFNPALLGTARAKQTAIPQELIKSTVTYKKTNNDFLGRLEVIGSRYLTYFSIDYLFIKGGDNPRLSSQVSGQFYRIDAVFLLVGFLSLLLYRSKMTVVLLCLVAITPIPGSVAGGKDEIPHAARALFMMGSMNIIAAYGFYRLITFSSRIKVRSALAVFFLMIVGYFFSQYSYNYFTIFKEKHAIEWQYGMKQVVEYIKDNPYYSQIYITDVRGQPYIFFLYYLNTTLPEFRSSVVYNQTQSRPHNLVHSFSHYNFGNWNPIESMPNPGVLYILSPSEYDGLKYRTAFEVKKIIKYPNGADAFFIVSAL